MSSAGPEPPTQLVLPTAPGDRLLGRGARLRRQSSGQSHRESRFLIRERKNVAGSMARARGDVPKALLKGAESNCEAVTALSTACHQAERQSQNVLDDRFI